MEAVFAVSPCKYARERSGVIVVVVVVVVVVVM